MRARQAGGWRLYAGNMMSRTGGVPLCRALIYVSPAPAPSQLTHATPRTHTSPETCCYGYIYGYSIRSAYDVLWLRIIIDFKL